MDFETRGYLDVRNVGAWRYAEDEHTEIMSMAYTIGDEPTQLWTPCTPFPQRVLELVEAGSTFEGHGIQFERAVWINILASGQWTKSSPMRSIGQDVGPECIPVPKRWRDTMAVAAYRSLPLSLDEVGAALDLPIQKDKRGKYLIQTLCTPKWGTKTDPDRIYREDWDLMEEFYDYNIRDNDTEKGLSNVLGSLPNPEQRVWVLDQVINQRGVRLDVEAAEAALLLIRFIEKKFNSELKKITDEQVTAATQRDRLLRWLRENDVEIVDLRADTVTAALKYPDMPKPQKRALEIRGMLAKSSTRKIQKMLDTVCRDGRIRGMLQYHGASTGRWAGRLAQPQNYPRGDLEKYAKQLGMKGREAEVMALLIDLIKLALDDPEAAFDAIDVAFGEPMNAIATALRGMFVAAPGKKLMVSDFSAIEAVVTSWVAGENWKLDAFRAIQRGEKYKGADDIYCAAAMQIFQRPVTRADNPKERGVGKICELAFGYQGALGAWRQFDDSDNYTDEEVEGFCHGWRLSHPATAGQYNEEKGYFFGGLWRGLQAAAISAVETGKPHSYSCVTYDLVDDRAGRWLTCTLPNGRRLWYYDPVVTYSMSFGRERPSLTYMGRNNKRGGAWSRIHSYGGMLTENVVQAISRDLMVEAMIRLERAGYRIVLTVHDEVVAEVDEDFGSSEEFDELMSVVPPWATDCPIGVAGWSGNRYMKG